MEALPGLGPEFGPLSMRASVEDWQKTELTLSLDGGGMLAGVETDLKAGSVDTLHAAIQPTRLDRLLPELSGSVTAELEAGSFDWDAARLGATIALQEVGYRGWSAGDIDTGISFVDGTTRVLLRGPGPARRGPPGGYGPFFPRQPGSTAQLPPAAIPTGWIISCSPETCPSAARRDGRRCCPPR